MLKTCFLGAILLACSAGHAAFNETLWGARPAALSGSFSALADDANSPSYNPAGLSQLTQNQLTLMYARLYQGINFYNGNDTSRLGLGYFSYAPQIKNKKFGSYALSWSHFSATNLYQETTLTLSVADSYEFERFSQKPIVSYGANVKLLNRSFTLDDRTQGDPVFQNGADSHAFSIDVGLLVEPRFSELPGIKLALVGRDVTRPDVGLVAVDRVPTQYTLGLAYQDHEMPLINPTLDWTRREDESVVSVGWESWFSQRTFAFRLGGNQDQFTSGFGTAFGFGSKWNMNLDYAFLWPLKVEGSNGTHRISITSSF